MNLKVYDLTGQIKKEIELKDTIFNIEPNRYAIYEVIKNELANARQGTSSVKTRGEVQGSKTKPWKQKGTGRARVGTKRNPIWRHGGVAFGPKPRDFSYSIPKKVKNLAYKSIFSYKIKKGDLMVIEDFNVESGKTKDFLNATKSILNNDKTVFILTDKDVLLKRASRNLPYIAYLTYNRLNVHTLFYSKKILIIESAIIGLNDMFSENKKVVDEVGVK